MMTHDISLPRVKKEQKSRFRWQREFSEDVNDRVLSHHTTFCSGLPLSATPLDCACQRPPVGAKNKNIGVH